MPGFAFVFSGALRVASLDLCADEYLLMFGRPETIVSTSFLSHDEEESPLAGKARAYPDNDGSIESVLERRPDLLLTTRPIDGARARIARRMGIETLYIPYASDARGVASNVEMLSVRLGNRSAGRRWKHRFDVLASRPPAPLRRVLWTGTGGLSPGETATSWLSFAGFEPVTMKAGLSSVEQVVSAKADRLLVSDYRAGQYARGSDWRSHPLVEKRRLPTSHVDGRAWTCAGPLMLVEIERLARSR